MKIEKLLAEFGEREGDKLYGRESISVSQDAFKAGTQSVGVLLIRAVAALEKLGHRSEPYKLSGERTYGYLLACEDIISDANEAIADLTRALEEGQ